MTKKVVFLRTTKRLKFFLIFNVFFIIPLFALSNSAIAWNVNTNLFSVQVENVMVKDVLNYIEKNSNYIFIYSDEVQKILGNKVSVSVSNKNIETILKELSSKTGLVYSISGKQITISMSQQKPKVQQSSKSNKRSLTGYVRDADTKEPLIGVSIVEKGTRAGTITNADGVFNIKVDDESELEISYIGYKKQIVKAGHSNSINISLIPDNKMLSEVVVVGYGTQKKVNLTGSVASVDMTKLSESRPITNISSGLAGLVPGLYVKSSSNTPGSDASLLIRGQGTLNNSSPLVIVDGVESSFSSVTPQDIATISVLKDAASSAIYGSRAANGVILITTKRGEKGKVKFNYDAYISGQSVAHKVHFVSSNADYMELQNEAMKNSGASTMFSDANIKAWREHDGENSLEWPSTDWANAVFRTSWTTNHNFSLSGGTDFMNSFLSFNYQNTPGIIENTGYKRYALRTNNEMSVTHWLKIGMNLNAAYAKQQAGASNVPLFFESTSNCVPSIVIKGPDGKWGGTNNSEENLGGCLSPLSYLYRFTGEDNTRSMNSKFFVTLTPVKGLTVNASYHYNYSDQKTVRIPHDLIGWNFQTNQTTINWAYSPSVTDKDIRSIRNLMDANVSYENKLFDQQLRFKIMMGASQEQYKSEWFSGLRNDLIDENLNQLNACTGTAEAYGSSSDWSMRSYFGRVNLSWSGKYLFEFNYRQDGSSRFDKNNRWGGFPSISAGWNISEEPFMASMKQTWLDNLKLRASWGSLGNNSVGNYATIPTMSQALYVLNGNPVNGFVSSLVNGNLKWESTYVTNIGLDFIIKNRLNGSIDFYNKLTKNILSQLPIPLENGLVDAPYQNSAKVRNRGLEVNLGWQDKIGMVNYFVKGNFTYNENKVIKFKGSERSINGTTMIQEGYGINTQYVRKVNRIIQTDADVALVQDIINKAPEGKNPFPNGVPVKGDLLYKDMNKDGLINDDDRVPVGHGANPRFMYGLSFGVNWKGLDFSCQMDGIAGIKAYYNNNFYTVSLGEPQIINKKIADGRWYEGRTDAKFPRLTNKSITKNVLNSDFWIKNNSFIKVRNIQLGYTIPSFITQKVNISRLRLYTSLENFFTITNYPGLDPEVAGMNYPQMKQAVLGINLSF